MLVVLGVLIGSAEQLLPDAHDAGATVVSQSEIDRGEPGDHGGAAAVQGSNTAGDRHELPPQLPVHATHVDHCAHSHLLTLADDANTTDGCAIPADAYDLSSQKLASISLPPHKRPPIA